MGIGSIGKFLRGYEFQGLTKAVTEAQLEIYKLPYKNYTQMGEKMAWTAGYTAASIAAQFAEIPFYVGVSTLRACGLFNPPLPEPPSFPSPHDNAEFMSHSVERALWDWQPELREEMREGIADGLAEKWNIFQAIGEWCLAFSYENASKTNYYKPTFLVASEPLESGESYKSVGVAFAALKKKDRDAILKAIYHQTEIGSVGEAAKKVYQDIRALGSKLQQGNEGYLSAFKEYLKRKEAEDSIGHEPAPRSLVGRATAPSIASAEPAYIPLIPPYMHDRINQYYNSLNQAPHGAPSAPSWSTEPSTVQNILRDLEFLRNALEEGISSLSNYEKKQILDSIRNHSALAQSKRLVARFSLLHFFKQAFKERGSMNVPEFLWIRALAPSGKNIHAVGLKFADLNDSDYKKLQKTVADPSLASYLDATLRTRLAELDEFAAMLATNSDFVEMYRKLQIDLIAD